jgi:rubrerythrin
MTDAADAIEELQKVNRERTELYEDAVKQLPKHGEWVGVSPTVDTVQCSICGEQLFSAELETPYCPNCGSKMGVQE